MSEHSPTTLSPEAALLLSAHPAGFSNFAFATDLEDDFGGHGIGWLRAAIGRDDKEEQVTLSFLMLRSRVQAVREAIFRTLHPRPPPCNCPVGA